MQTAWAGKPGIQSSIQNAFGVPQHFSRVSEGETLEKILRRNGRPRREQTMEVMLAQTDTPGERRQVRLVGVAFIQIPDDARNPFVIVHMGTLPWGDNTTTRFFLLKVATSSL